MDKIQPTLMIKECSRTTCLNRICSFFRGSKIYFSLEKTQPCNKSWHDPLIFPAPNEFLAHFPPCQPSHVNEYSYHAAPRKDTVSMQDLWIILRRWGQLITEECSGVIWIQCAHLNGAGFIHFLRHSFFPFVRHNFPRLSFSGPCNFMTMPASRMTQ